MRVKVASAVVGLGDGDGVALDLLDDGHMVSPAGDCTELRAAAIGIGTRTLVSAIPLSGVADRQIRLLTQNFIGTAPGVAGAVCMP